MELPSHVSFLPLSLLLTCFQNSLADPITKPYIAHLTDPFDQSSDHVTTQIAWERQNPNSSSGSESDGDGDPNPHTKSIVSKIDSNNPNLDTCPSPIHFTIRRFPVTHSSSHHTQESGGNSINSSPVIVPIHPSDGPAKSLLFLRQSELLEVMDFSPPIHRGVVSNQNSALILGLGQQHIHEDAEFPLLFQGSTFISASPVIYDVNGDGIEDVILVDYNGHITIVGLELSKDTTMDGVGMEFKRSTRPTRYMEERTIPRLVVRKDWVKESQNSTLMEEYSRAGLNVHHSYFEYDPDWRRQQESSNQKAPIRGRSAHALDQSLKVAQKLSRPKQVDEVNVEISAEIQEQPSENQDGDDEVLNTNAQQQGLDDMDDIAMDNPILDDYYDPEQRGTGTGDDFFGDAYYAKPSPEDIFRHDFYKDDFYIHIPSHVTSTPSYLESMEDHVRREYFCFSVSYYFDEDDYHSSDATSTKNEKGRFQSGEDSETNRGQFLASGLVLFDIHARKVTEQIHLDLSTDYTAPLPSKDAFDWQERDYNGMGAFALASPTVADLDGDQRMEVLIGTSMGMIFCLNAPRLERVFNVQMKGKIDHPIIVEDVLSDKKLEILSLYSLGNVICLDHTGRTIWHRDLVHEEHDIDIRETSSMTLGDIDGDGRVDIVISVIISYKDSSKQDVLRVYAITAINGDDLKQFPIELSMPNDEPKIGIFPNPILVHLHAQPLFDSVRNHGSDTETIQSQDLHIIQAIETKLFVIEGRTGCLEQIDVGKTISTTPKVDSVYGNGDLSVVITTVSGEVLVLDSPSLAFHPFNKYTRTDSSVHGFSASSGILIHQDDKVRSMMGMFVPITFEIFDTKFSEGSDSKYYIEMRHGTFVLKGIITISIEEKIMLKRVMEKDIN